MTVSTRYLMCWLLLLGLMRLMMIMMKMLMWIEV